MQKKIREDPRTMDMVQGPEEKYANLLNILSAYSGALVAFSGGVDSLLLLHAAVDALGKEKVKAVIGLSPTLPGAELKEAEEHTRVLGVRLHQVKTGVMNWPDFTSNPVNRCFHCRKNLSMTLSALGGKKISVLDGANVSDLSDYRPGIQAANEAGVRHPLIDANITKQDVREVLRFLGYSKEVYNRPSSPCLSSRIPYEQEITMEKLRRIEKAELCLKNLGFRELRVRHFDLPNGPIAGIEISEIERGKLDQDNKVIIVNEFRKLGFIRVFLDMEGFRSGSLNEGVDGTREEER